MQSFYLSLLFTITLFAGVSAQPRTSSLPVPGTARTNGALQGSILIAAPAGQQPDQFAGGHFQVELWHVTYAPDKQDANTTDIYLQQKVNAGINVQLSQGGLQYSVANAPSTPGLAIIMYVNNQPDNTPLQVFGHPTDGRPADKSHRYNSNVKKLLGKNIVFGIYSLDNQGSAGASADFRVVKATPVAGRHQAYDLFGDISNAVGDLADDVVKFVTKTVNGVEHTFDQTINGVAGLSKCVVNDINGIANAANFFIDEAGRFYYLTAAGLDNLILYGNLPRTRDITNQEYAWANKMIYNGTLPAINRIKIFNFMHLAGDNHRFYTWPAPAGDYIYVNIGDAFDNPMQYTNTAYPSPGQAFIHELGHSWQCGKYGFINMLGRYFSAPGGLTQTYDPGCPVNNVNSNYNLEQEATLIDRSYVELYYPEKQDPYCCSFSIPWVEQHVRNGVAFDKMNNPALWEMVAVSGPVGGPANWNIFHSGGNPTDGDGYFMVGRINNGFLHYSNKTRIAACQWGAIRERYIKANYEFGALGWPARTEMLLPDGVGFYQKFDHGFIYSHPKYGTYIIMNDIFDPWSKDGWEKGKLGYPVSDLTMFSNGHGFQKFVGGVIFFNPSPGGKTDDGSTFLRFGNPDAIVNEYIRANAGVRVMINPQPLPPRVPPKNASIH